MFGDLSKKEKKKKKIFFLGGWGSRGGEEGGLTNERPQTDHVITGPMRGLKKNHMGRGQVTSNNNRRTSRLLVKIVEVIDIFNQLIIIM